MLATQKKRIGSIHSFSDREIHNSVLDIGIKRQDCAVQSKSHSFVSNKDMDLQYHVQGVGGELIFHKMLDRWPGHVFESIEPRSSWKRTDKPDAIIEGYKFEVKTSSYTGANPYLKEWYRKYPTPDLIFTDYHVLFVIINSVKVELQNGLTVSCPKELMFAGCYPSKLLCQPKNEIPGFGHGKAYVIPISELQELPF